MGVIQKQGIWNTLISYVGIIIGFVNIIFIQPRFLTPEELGLIRVLFSFSSIIALFLPLGIGNITLRFFPGFKDERSGNHGFFAYVLLFPLIGFLLFGSALLLLKSFIIGQYIEQSRLFTDYFNFVFPLLFLLSYVSVLGIYSSVLYKTMFISFMNDIAVRVLSIILVAAYFNHWLTLDSFIYCFVGIYGLQALAILGFIFIYHRPKLIPDLSFLKTLNLKEILKFGFVLWFIALAGFALKTLDMVLLGKYVPLALVGIYSVCAFIPLVIETPLIALDRISAPKIGEAWSKNDLKEIADIYHKSSHYLMIIGGLMTAGILANTPDLLLLLPEKFAVGENVIYIISLGTFVNMSTGLNDPIIFYSKKYQFGMLILLLLIVASFILNSIFIPDYGMVGAAIVAMILNMSYNIGKYLFIYLRFNLQPFTSDSLKILGVILLTTALGFLIPSIGEPILTLILRSFVMLSLFVTLILKLNLAPEIVKFLKRK